LEQDELAYAMNADLFLELGTIRVRRGRSALITTRLSDLVVRRVARVNSIRYQVAGTVLYRAGSSIRTGLSDNLVTTIQGYRPLNDTSTWAFVADANGMYKDDGTNLWNWGITAPSATPGVGTTGTGLTGVYHVKFTYCRKVGSTVICESNPSPASAAQTLANQSLAITGMTASSDGQVTHIRIYRTIADGANYYWDQDIANGTTTATSSQADDALGSELATDNDPPPACGYVSPPWEGRLWLCQDPNYPHYLYYTKRFQPEVVPTANFLEIGTPEDPLQCALPYGGINVVFARARKYRVMGTGTTPFVAQETPSKRGCPAWAAADIGEDGIYFLATDGIYKTNGFAADEQISGPIQPLFEGRSVNGYSPINFDQASKFSLRVWKRRVYASVADGDSTTPNRIWVNKIGTDRWQAYDHAMASLGQEEDTDYLVAGGHDGFVHRLETGNNDGGVDIAMTVDSKDYAHVTAESPTGPMARKLYHSIGEDLDGGTFGVTFYVDGATKYSCAIPTSRRPTPIRLPANSQGYRWRKRWTYSGTGQAVIYGTTTYAMPMEVVDG
jgi:hypothetical protein